MGYDKIPKANGYDVGGAEIISEPEPPEPPAAQADDDDDEQ